MLTRASFRNFKNLREVDVELDRFTVLVGPNGAGKTSVLQGVHLLTQLGLRHKPDAELVEALTDEKQPRYDYRGLFSGRWTPARLVTAKQTNFRLALSERGSDGTSSETVALTVALGKEQGDEFSLDLPGAPTEALASRRLRHLAAAVYLNLDVSVMVRPSLVQSEKPRLEHDGENLASALAYLAGDHPDLKEAIEADVAAIVPWFKRVLVRNARVTRLTTRPFPVGREAVNVPVEEDVWGHRFAVETTDGAVVPADLVSEGTVLVLGLMTMLHGPTAPRLVLLDDLDRALHLGAQVRLVHSLQKLLQRRADLQIVASSHSPYLVQELPAANVQVLGLTPQGVRCRSLASHPEYDRWKTALGTGEIWANLGEEWVGDGA